MLDSYHVREGSLKNVEKDGFVIGFKFDVLISGYRGCFLSLHNGYYIEVDGEEFPRALQKFEVNGKPPRDFDEISKCYWEHWNYGDWATVYVQKPGGLSKGMHRLGVVDGIMTQYGWEPHDQEWIDNPPDPRMMFGPKKAQSSVYYYDMEVE